MKRLSHYLKNKSLNSVTLLTIFTVYVIFYYTLTYWGDLIPFELVEYGNLNYFLFGSHSLQIDMFGLSIHNELVFGFLAFLISFLNFKFLHKKSLGLTTLSFPKTRAQLYNKRVALPVILLITSGLIAKTIALYWNSEFYGFSNELMGAYFTNVLILVQYILFGTALGIFGRVFTARTFEGILTSAGFLFIPKTIYVLIDALSPLFLYGYEGFYNNDYANFLDPVRDYIYGYGYHLEIPITEPVSYGNIIYSAFWIVASVIALFVLKKYFIKNTKYENTGINNKIPFITTITSAVFPLAIATFAYYGNTAGYITTDAKKKEIFVIVTILALVFGYIINSIITKTVLFKKEKAIIISGSNETDKITVLNRDLKDIDDLKAGSFDVVTMNPPYKIQNGGIKNDENFATIARHETLCNMDDIAKSASRLLRFGGKLCICQRPERVFDVMYSMRENGIEPKTLRFVSKKGDTQPWLVLIEGKRGAKNGLKVLGNLVAYNDDGTLTDEMLSITEKYRK